MASGVSVVIPVFNAFDAAARCLASVYGARTEIPFEVIAVDNGSDGRFDEYLGPARAAYRDFRTVRFPEPLGFPRAANEGARRARHEYLVLLNSDTVVTDWWLDDLAAALTSDPGLAVVSPVTNRCGHDAQVAEGAAGIEASQIPEFAASIRGRTGAIPEPQLLTFFCVMIRRTVWERLAGLDEVYHPGYSEDDDFCLRARLAGYRMAIVPSVFVFHAGNATFDANGLNKAELLARSQAIFHERASRWSRSILPATAASGQADSVSVILPLLPSALPGLRDSLVSLCNQTVSGFETVLVHHAHIDISKALAGIAGRLQIATKAVSGTPEELAPLLNAGLAAAGSRRIAYLLPGDVFYPFHVEVLSQTMDRYSLDAAYCAWSVYSDIDGKERRGAVTLDQAEPLWLPWGDWAPLVCWMHERDASPSGGFDETFTQFAGWRFVLGLAQRAHFRYLRRFTIERRLHYQPPFYSSRSVLEAERILGAARKPWQHFHRLAFLDALRTGCWERRLVIERNEVQRRARRLVGASGIPKV